MFFIIWSVLLVMLVLRWSQHPSSNKAKGFVNMVEIRLTRFFKKLFDK